jgi:tRNA modification GTPase
VVRNYHDDTIAAVATALGESAIAVVRVSGSTAITAISSIFSGKKRLEEAASYTAHYGKLMDTTRAHIDDVIVTVFRAPHSYSGEDLVEVSCHGGLFNTQRVFSAILSTGVRQAEPGEFTKRAFLNGKLDLLQAEAVASLICSKSEASHRASVYQLEGRFSNEVGLLRDELVNLGSLLELELDFSEDGLDLVSKANVLERIERVGAQIERMKDSYEVGKVVRDGVSVVIVGKPNAGKSSLFNALLKENRAIVTDVPGTTRDSLEESIHIGGVLFRLHDTAGLRDSVDPIEVEGVARAKRLLHQADIQLQVVDGSEADSIDIGRNLTCELNSSVPAIIVRNKADLCRHLTHSAGGGCAEESRKREVWCSALTGEGLSDLRLKLLEVVGGERIEANSLQVLSKRHYECLRSAFELLASAREATKRGMSGEFIALDVRAASDSLAEIIGMVTSDDVLNSIFNSFCIGK